MMDVIPCLAFLEKFYNDNPQDSLQCEIATLKEALDKSCFQELERVST